MKHTSPIRVALAKKRRCDTCRVRYFTRAAHPRVCLECDIAERLAEGETAAVIAAALRLPEFLIEAVNHYMQARSIAPTGLNDVLL